MNGVPILAVAVLLLALAGEVSAQRVALVIGNTAYENAEPLRNPVNDATEIAAKLEKLGFTVHLGLDLSQREALEHFERYAKDLSGAEAAVFYYSGHGIQLGGVNYLLPVDVNVETELDLRYGAIDLGDVIGRMEDQAQTSIVVLDACRNNPFAETLKRSLPPSRSLVLGNGLAPTRLSGSGAIIAYSAAAGAVASDGAGNHSPYTAALLEEIEKPDVEVGLVFRRVAGKVVEETNGRQRPELLVRLTREFYLNRSPESAPISGATSAASDNTSVAADTSSVATGAGLTDSENASVAAEAATSESAVAQIVTSENTETLPDSGAGNVQNATASLESDQPDVPQKRLAAVAPAERFYSSRWGYTAAVSPRPVFEAGPIWAAPPSTQRQEREPNNDFATRQIVSPQDAIEFSIHPRGDCDHFELDIGAAGELVSVVDPAAPELDVAVRLRNNDWENVYSTAGSSWTKAARNGGALEATHHLPAAGKYWMDVCDGGNNAESLAAMQLDLSYQVVRDALEPNNSIGTATQIDATSEQEIAILPKGESDFLRITVDTPGALSLLASRVPEVMDVAIRVLNASGDTLYDTNGQSWVVPARKGGETEAIVDLPRPGSYFIQVADSHHDAASADSFLFTSLFTPSVDRYEPNNKPGDAWRIEPGGEHQLTILPKGDSDWLELEVGHPGELQVLATDVPAALDVTFNLKDASGAQLYDTRGSSWVKPSRKGADTETLFDLPSPGTYRLQIADSGHNARAIEPFTLQTTYTATADQFEPNNSFGTASSIRVGGELAFNILPKGDRDWFRIEVPEPGALTIELDESPADLDLAFRVLDSDQQPIYIDGSSWIKPARKGGFTQGVADLPRPGQYFIDVADSGSDARSVEPAVLRTRFVPTPDSHEPNNTIAQAMTVPLTGETVAHILPVSDGDWMRLQVPSPGALTVSIEDMPENLDVSFRVVDENRQAVYIDGSSWVRPPRPGGFTEGVVRFEKAGTYYLELRDGDNNARSPQPFRVIRSFVPTP